jgi:hypothetical protein
MAKRMKRRMGGVVSTEGIEKEKIRIRNKVKKRQMNKDEALVAAEAIEILEAEVNNAK